MDRHYRCQQNGTKKTFKLTQQQFYGISREEVSWVIKNCNACIQRQPSRSRPPLEPITSSYTLERVQIDLVDMQVTPDKGYHWVLHIKDHFSKYSFLYPLTDKTAARVATCIAQWLGIVEIATPAAVLSVRG